MKRRVDHVQFSTTAGGEHESESSVSLRGLAGIHHFLVAVSVSLPASQC